MYLKINIEYASEYEHDQSQPDSQEVWAWQEMSAMMVFPSGRGETPGETNVTVSGHKQQNWKVQNGLQLRPGWCSVTH